MMAVEWFEKELQKNFDIEGVQPLYDDILDKAKELEKQKQDEFAIGLLHWFSVFDGKFNGPMTDSEILEAYRKELI
jgi:hypothetical protein